MYYKKWNKNKIIEQLKLLTKMVYRNPSPELAIAINTLDDLLNNQPNLFTPEERFDQQVKQDVNLVHNHSEFMPYIREFSKHSKSFNTSRIPPLEVLDIPTRQLTAFVHDFYNSIDRDFAKYFNRIFKERYNNLRITTNNIDGFNRNYVTYIDSLKYAYINIYKSNTIDDFTGLVHEYAHTIADQFRYRSHYGKYPFIELLPILMEELAYDELIRCFDGLEFEVFKSDAYSIGTILKFTEEIVLQEDYLSKNNPDLPRKQFINSMAHYTNNTKSKTEKILNITLQEKLSYVIPFLVAIELYNMMYEDREKCLYITKKIITMDECNDYISYLDSLGIHINETSDEYIEEQKKILRLTDLL